MAKKEKKVESIVKLQIPAGQANPSPPVGPALGQAGLNIMDFCNAFNSQTSNSEPGMLIPVVISVYKDKSFTGDDLEIPIHYLDRSQGWSTTKFKRLIVETL